MDMVSWLLVFTEEMNRLAVGWSARAQQAHKVDNRIDRLHKVDNRFDRLRALHKFGQKVPFTITYSGLISYYFP